MKDLPGKDPIQEHFFELRPETVLPCLKGMFAFRLAATSYIIPAPILPNLHFLGQYLDEIEVVLFESGRESNLPSPEEVREMAQVGRDLNITFNIHLPTDLFFGDPDPNLRKKFQEKALRFYERTLPLDPTLYILHLDSRRADGTKEEDQRAWMDRVTRSVERLSSQGLDLARVAVENLEYPLERIRTLVESSHMSFCLDIGHLLRYGFDLDSSMYVFLEKSSMIHLHGVNGGKDHCGVEWIPKEQWETISRALANYRGGVSLEVFSLADLASSLKRLHEITQGKVTT